MPLWMMRWTHGKLPYPELALAVLRLISSPLCVEEFDLSDRNFRPCPCGYQVSTITINLPQLADATIGLSVLLQQHQKQHEWTLSSMSETL